MSQNTLCNQVAINVAFLHSRLSNHMVFTSKDIGYPQRSPSTLKPFKLDGLHLKTLPKLSNEYKGPKTTQVNIFCIKYLFKQSINTKQYLQHPNAHVDTSKAESSTTNRSKYILQSSSNQISSLLTHMSGRITYWNSKRLEFRLQKKKHKHKGIQTMLGVRWYPSPHVLSFIVLFHHGSYNILWDNSKSSSD